MNRGDLAELKARLTSRAAAEAEDSPLALGVAAVLWAFLVLVMAFL